MLYWQNKQVCLKLQWYFHIQYVWGELCILSWRLLCLEYSKSSLIHFTFCTTVGPLKEFLVTATALSLTVMHVDVLGINPHGPMLHKFGMTEKKYHEVTEMIRLVTSMAKHHGIKQVWHNSTSFVIEHYCLLMLCCVSCQLNLIVQTVYALSIRKETVYGTSV